MKRLQNIRLFICAFVMLLAVRGYWNSSKAVQAKKYYSLQEIGLTGCTKDDIDYGIVSVRGNTIRYVTYQYESNQKCWKRTYGIKVAKLTSATKYYIGCSSQVSNDLKEMQKNKNGNTSKAKKKMRRARKSIDTEKWILRTRKSKVKRNLCIRNNEIFIQKGKVQKILVGNTY